MKFLIIQIKKNKILAFLSAFSLFLLLVLLIFPVKVDKRISTLKNEKNYPMLAIKNNTIIKQDFVSAVDKMNSIEMMFSTYNVINTVGKVKVTIESEKNIFYSKTFELSQIKDNSLISFDFPIQNNSLDKKYTISLKFSELNKKSSIAMWYFNNEKGLTYTENEKSTTNILTFTTTGEEKSYIFVWYPLLSLTICFTLLVVSNSEKKGDRYEK